MRISDWSSDVCSSDLEEGAEDVQHPLEALDQRHAGEDEDGAQHECPEDAPEQNTELVGGGHPEERQDHRPHEHVVDREALLDQEAGEVLAAGLAALPHQHEAAEPQADGRSEEHTSELQSLMRISY